MIFAAVIALVVAVEWKIKDHMEKSMKDNVVREVAGDRLLLRKCHNKGVAGGIGEEKPQVVKWGTFGILLCFVLDFLQLTKSKGRIVEKTGYALALGGGFSNWLDRVRQGFVTDYFSFNTKWKKLRRLVFNLADMCVILGGILIVFGRIFGKEEAAEK